MNCVKPNPAPALAPTRTVLSTAKILNRDPLLYLKAVLDYAVKAKILKNQTIVLTLLLSSVPSAFEQSAFGDFKPLSRLF